MQTADLPRVTLYYREGNSDKVYQCAIEASGDKFVVNFAYGRRGSTLSTGTKTSAPVDYETAKSVYDKLVREKTAKGYTPGADGTPYKNTTEADRFTHILPQLLNPIEEPQLQALLNDRRFGAQEKFDGWRMLLQKEGAAIHGINRKGLVVGLPSTLIPASTAVPGDFVIDGEAVGDILQAFDLLFLNGKDLRSLPYDRRYQALLDLLLGVKQFAIRLAPLLISQRDKSALLRSLKDGKREGIVFKQLDAPCQAGRPNAGGPALKHKFTATLSAVVSAINPQRSVELRLIGKIGWVTAGNVTIPANHPIPAVGDVVEVRYLYAFPESGVLYQPVYLGTRTDIEPAECMTVQLKFKSTEEA